MLHGQYCVLAVAPLLCPFWTHLSPALPRLCLKTFSQTCCTTCQKLSCHCFVPVGYLVTHTRLTALCPGLPRWAGTRKVKPNWILLKQETVNSTGIRWAICKSAPRSRQITMPAPHRSVFYGCVCACVMYSPKKLPGHGTEKQWDTCYGVSVVYHSLVSRYRIMETVPSWYGCKIYNQHVYLHISKPEVQTLWNFLYVNCGHCLVLLLWKCNRYELLDVIFAHNGQSL